MADKEIDEDVVSGAPDLFPVKSGRRGVYMFSGTGELTFVLGEGIVQLHVYNGPESVDLTVATRGRRTYERVLLDTSVDLVGAAFERENIDVWLTGGPGVQHLVSADRVICAAQVLLHRYSGMAMFAYSKKAESRFYSEVGVIVGMVEWMVKEIAAQMGLFVSHEADRGQVKELRGYSYESWFSWCLSLPGTVRSPDQMSSPDD